MSHYPLESLSQNDINVISPAKGLIFVTNKFVNKHFEGSFSVQNFIKTITISKTYETLYLNFSFLQFCKTHRMPISNDQGQRLCIQNSCNFSIVSSCSCELYKCHRMLLDSPVLLLPGLLASISRSWTDFLDSLIRRESWCLSSPTDICDKMACLC